MLGASSLLTACKNQSETNTTIETKQVVADPEYEVKNPYTLLTNGHGLFYEEVDPNDRRSTDELPAEYTQIEYLESTGKQKIDTGYIPNEQTQIEAKFFVPSNIGTSYASNIFTSRTVGLEYDRFFMGGYGKQNTYLTSNAVNEIFLSSTKYTLTANGSQRYNLSFTATNFSNERNLYIFGTSGSTAVFEASYMGYNAYNIKLYTFKISEKDPSTSEVTYVRDFVPCVKDNILGLFDVIEQKFYENDMVPFNIHNDLQGSGTENDPYQISSVEDLLIMNGVSGGSSGQSSKNVYCFVVTNDIEFNDGYFERNQDGSCTYHDGGDGVLYDWHVPYAFFKKFDGQKHKLKNFYSTHSGLFSLLLYGEMPSGGTKKYSVEICNIEMMGGYCTDENMICPKTSMLITCHRYSVDSVISNCMVDGCVFFSGGNAPQVSLIACVSGSSGYSSTINDCISKGKITTTQIGCGLVFLQIPGAHINNCENYADVTSSNGSVAGITYAAGSSYFSNCKNFGKIRGAGCVGGVSFSTSGEYKSCYNFGSVTATGSSTNTYAGGVSAGSGYTYYSVRFYSCGNEGEVFTTGTAAGVYSSTRSYQGISNMDFENCYNKGNISADYNAYGISLSVFVAKNCINYGNISQAGTGLVAAGLFGTLYTGSSAMVYGCKNYGNVASNKVCGIVGKVIILSNSTRPHYVLDCANYGNLKGDSSAVGILSTADGGSFTHLSVRNCVNKGYLIGKNSMACGIMGGLNSSSGNAQVLVENCLNEGALKSSSRAYGITSMFLTATTSKMSVRNCISRGALTQISNNANYCYLIVNSSAQNAGRLDIQNCIADCKVLGQQTRQFWGNDFSAFFVHRMTGRIGLKELESIGRYMLPIPSASYLENDLNFTRAA